MAEVAPQAGDLLDQPRVAELFARAEQEVHSGRLPSCQLALARGTQIVAAAFGQATAESRYVLFSVTKALLAGAAWSLMSDGTLSPQTVVADVVAEFATNDKHTVTVEHLLTHTAGFPHAPMRPEEGATSAGRVARFAQWHLDFPPGTQVAYHPTSAHWVLAELLERIAGADYRQVVTQRVIRPLGLQGLELGIAARDQDDIVDVVIVGDAAAASMQLGEAFAEARADRLLRYNEPEVRAVGVPGAGAVGSATAVARYFQILLRGEPTVWDTDLLADATRTIRCRLVDPLTNVPANRSLGLVVAGDDGNAWLRDLGRTVGPRTFGASGIGGQVAWADPDSGVSYCFLTNGLDHDVVASFLRSSELSTLAGRCARLT